MDKRALAVVLLMCIIYVSSVFAITITDVSTPTQTDAQAQSIAKLNADIQAKFEALNKRLDQYPTQEEILKDAQALLTAQQQLLDSFLSTLITMFIIIGLCFTGLAYGVFFYFKSKGRI